MQNGAEVHASDSPFLLATLSLGPLSSTGGFGHHPIPMSTPRSRAGAGSLRKGELHQREAAPRLSAWAESATPDANRRIKLRRIALERRPFSESVWRASPGLFVGAYSSRAALAAAAWSSMNLSRT